MGIDCSGLACHLLNHLFKVNLDVRKTSADMLTSPPLSRMVTDIQTGDLVRQKKGHHVLFIIETKDNIAYYVDSSLSGSGVRLGSFNLTDPSFPNQGIFRLKQTI